MPATIIHENMRRCLLQDDGTVNYYLDKTNSLLKDGEGWADEQSAGAGTSGMTLEGTWNNAVVGKYVYNVTKDFEAQILTVSGSTLTFHPPMQTIGTNWGEATATTANKLVDSGASFITDGIQPGMIVSTRDLTSTAVVQTVDSETELTLSADIIVSGDKYSIMEGFEVGDVVRIGSAVFDGTDGQVMVEIPKFYMKYVYDGTNHNWNISPVPAVGYRLHPAFHPAGVEKDYIYISAFEGSVATARDFASQRLIDFDLATNSLTSLPALTPLTNGQRSEFRQVAGNRGSGWHQWDQATNWALQLLFMIEYETLHSQSVHTGVTDWDFSTQVEPFSFNASNNRSIQQTGYTLRNGNVTIMSGSGGNASQIFSYRGIENFYGHLWKFVDGINVSANKPYLSNSSANYADDTTINYVDQGFTMPGSNGYIGEIHSSNQGLFPKTNNGGSSTYLCDYYQQSTGWRVVLSGGYSYTGDQAGFAALNANTSSGFRSSAIGSRACFR